MRAVTLVDALKRMLKGRGVTYARVAEDLGLSEASVKRMSSGAAWQAPTVRTART